MNFGVVGNGIHVSSLVQSRIQFVKSTNIFSVFYIRCFIVFYIRFILFIVHSQAQTSQTDNGGGLRGGAAGYERLLTAGTDALDYRAAICGRRCTFFVLISQTSLVHHCF